MEKVTPKKKSLTIWLIMWVVLNVADWALTYIVLQQGGAETNEIFSRMSLPLFAVSKFLAPLAVIPVLAYINRKDLVAGLVAGQFVIVFHNLTWIL